MLHQIFMYSDKVMLAAGQNINNNLCQITYPPTEWTNWPINDIHVSKLNFPLSIYSRISYIHLYWIISRIFFALYLIPNVLVVRTKVSVKFAHYLIPSSLVVRTKVGVKFAQYLIPSSLVVRTKVGVKFDWVKSN